MCDIYLMQLVNTNHQQSAIWAQYKYTLLSKRSFASAGPAAWNCLPRDVRKEPNINILKRKIKTLS